MYDNGLRGGSPNIYKKLYSVERETYGKSKKNSKSSYSYEKFTIKNYLYEYSAYTLLSINYKKNCG